jgi:hypothetical protein
VFEQGASNHNEENPIGFGCYANRVTRLDGTAASIESAHTSSRKSARFPDWAPRTTEPIATDTVGNRRLPILNVTAFETNEILPMPLYIFTSRSYPKVKAFTSDKTGGNLPDDYAPWYPAGSRAAAPAGVDFDPVGKAVQRDGYFLVSCNVRPSRQTNSDR